jgi:hypothetical protein
MESATDSEALHYLINHLFLPPKLPQEDDSGDVFNQALLSHIIESATAFTGGLVHAGVDATVLECWTFLGRMLRKMHTIHQGTQISAAELQRTVKNTEVRGASISA